MSLWIDALHQRGVGRRLDRRNDLVGGEADGRVGLRVDCDLHRIAEDVAGRSLPVLSFPLIVVQPHRLAVGAREPRVDVDERLHPVVAGRQVAQAAQRVAAVVCGDGRGCSGRQVLDVLREQRRTGGRGLLDRRSLVVAADGHVDHAGDRLGARAGAERDLDPDTGPAGRLRRHPNCGAGED